MMSMPASASERIRVVFVWLYLCGTGVVCAQPGDAEARAIRALRAAGVHGGLVVHVGCGDGRLTAGLGTNPAFSVHGVDTDAARVTAARSHIQARGVYGRVAVDDWDGARLPYASGLVNAVLVERNGLVATAEAMRVLAPQGVLLVRQGADWRTQVKPWPAAIDDWSHYLHDAGNNAVSHDTRIGPPRSLQWIGSPRWARHHDRLASLSALVSAGGKLFYIFDEGPTESIVLPSRWALIARDAFNGVVLWKKPIPDWQTRMWPLKSGPAQLPRRLVATRDTVFATLGVDVPLTAVDALTGEPRRVYEQTKAVEEVLHSDGVLFLLTDPELDTEKYTSPAAVKKPWWTGKTVKVMAVEADSGKTLWEHASSVAPLSLAVDAERVVFHDGGKIVCLDRGTGAVKWASEPVPLVKKIMSFFAPTMVLRDGVVLFAGGEESGLVKSGGGARKSDTLTALAGDTGKLLWTAEHLPSGYSSPEDLFVIDGVVWFGGVSAGGLPGTVKGLDLHTGAVKAAYEAADVDTFWFHHRCYRGKATDRYLMVSRTGIEFIDPKTGHWDINHWVRGGCLYGIMPANGLIYTPPHDCACYPESKLFGFGAFAPAGGQQRVRRGERLQRGPAYGEVGGAAPASALDWPTYRYDTRRNAAAPTRVPPKVAEKWHVAFGTKLSAVTVADGKAFVAAVDQHTVHAVDTASGERAWSFTAGGRVDSPPTIHAGTAIFGCADGWIYCLRASDGQLVWRFHAAPTEERIMAFEQLESRWPVHGSVLVHNGVVHAIAGRSLFLDGGMRLCRLDAATGALVGEQIMDDRDPDSGDDLHAHVKRLTMPVALPDVLSCDGKHIYMRSQVFDLNGKRLELAPVSPNVGAHAAVQRGETEHLFASAGFLDGDWFHRAYWVYGRKFEGGWNSYYLAGKKAPSGKMLVADDSHVYGFGRETKYFKWTVPLEFHLFAAPKTPTSAPRKPVPASNGSIVRVDNSTSLDPAKKPLTVMAWVRPERPDGVVLAHGGSVMGYTLFLRDGMPQFTVCLSSKRGTAAGKSKLDADWTHLAGVLTASAELRLYVNGELAGTAKAPGLLPKIPANPMQVGGDEESQVGDYENGLPFKGVLDEVRVYHRALDADAIARHAGGTLPDKAATGLALYYAFNKGWATDGSGKKNKGKVVGARQDKGKLGAGLRFIGKLPDATSSSGKERFAWSHAVPVLVRGMLVAGDTLFIVGPEDVLDEPAALKTLDEPETREKIAAQAAAFAGQRGGVLRAVSCKDGSTLGECRLDTAPAWDGLAAARGRLYMTGTDGTLRCYAGQ